MGGCFLFGYFRCLIWKCIGLSSKRGEYSCSKTLYQKFTCDIAPFLLPKLSLLLVKNGFSLKGKLDLSLSLKFWILECFFHVYCWTLSLKNGFHGCWKQSVVLKPTYQQIIIHVDICKISSNLTMNAFRLEIERFLIIRGVNFWNNFREEAGIQLVLRWTVVTL